MAVVTINPLLQGLRGRIGDFVFRNVNGDIIVSALPSMPSADEQSEVQKLNRDKFRVAARYAQRMMRDPVKKAYYWKRAKKHKLPNGYTAAIQDYMSRPQINDIDIHRYTGKVGGSIFVHAEKRRSSISEVLVTVMTRDGLEIERGNATLNAAGKWVYKNKVKTDGAAGLEFITVAKDVLGNSVKRIRTVEGVYHPMYGWVDPPGMMVEV